MARETKVTMRLNMPAVEAQLISCMNAMQFQCGRAFNKSTLTGWLAALYGWLWLARWLTGSPACLPVCLPLAAVPRFAIQ